MAHPEQFQSNALKAAQGSQTGDIHVAFARANIFKSLDFVFTDYFKCLSNNSYIASRP